VAAAKHSGRAARPERVGDGAGLYLQITLSGGKSWLFRYMLDGRAREMGLGTADPTGKAGGVTLAEAREKAAGARRLLGSRIDPLDQRRAEEAARKAAVAAARQSVARSFKSVADAMLAERESGWSNPKHRAQWEATLKGHAYPILGDMEVGAISTDDVLAALQPIWTKTPETASRVRGRIETVLDFARVRGWRAGENPARWRGHLAEILPKPGSVRRVVHRSSLHWREIPAFMAALQARDGIANRALSFAILTAARTGEVRLACWREIDLYEAVWVVPAERMKSRRRHRVPLSPQAMALLLAARSDERGRDSLVFPSPSRAAAPLSDMTLSAVVKRMNEKAEGEQPLWADAEGRPVVPHGFRSSFRDWVGETRPEGREVAEAALAHVVRDKAEAAYARSDLLEKRRTLMDAWGMWCGGPVAERLQREI
jgi:integrase